MWRMSPEISAILLSLRKGDDARGEGARKMKQDAPHETDVIGRSGAENAILPLLLMVLNDFHRQNISYCYWKSSRRVYRGLTGEGDLDLLIAKEDQHRAQAILLERGLKLFPCVAYRDHPAILSFLGCDEPSSR